jgi:hypothetical protein
MSIIPYMAQKERMKWCLIKIPRWPQNWTTPANPSSRKRCTKKLRNMYLEMRPRTILLVAAEWCLLCIWRQNFPDPPYYLSDTVYTVSDILKNIIKQG